MSTDFRGFPRLDIRGNSADICGSRCVADMLIKQVKFFLRVYTLAENNYRPRSEGDYVLGGVRPSVCLSVCQFVSLSLPVSGVCLCVCNQWAGADYCADAVDRLLI